MPTRLIDEQVRPFIERQSLGFLIKRCAALVTRRISDVLAPFDLTPSHWVVLACLWRQDGQSVSHIAGQVQQIGGTLTGVLDRMEKRKLLKRKRNAEDRRVYQVYLTKAGSDLIDEVPVRVQKMWTEMFHDIEQADIDRFSDLLNRLITNLSPSYQCKLPECDGKLSRKLSRILPPKSLGYRMRTTSMLMSREFNNRLEKHNVTSTHWIVLCRLWSSDGVPVSEIGQYLEQVGGTLAGVLERMEERGLIQRKVDESDRRRMLVYLSPEGERLFDVLPPIAIGMMSEVTSGLSGEEVDFLKNFLRKLIVNALAQI